MAATTKSGATKAASKPAAASKPSVSVHVAKEGERRCAARPQGPYGINAPKQCTNATRRPTAALCAVHEPMWREEARRRYAAKKATVATSKPKRSAKPTAPTSDEDLEAQLAASNAAFASPELAELHRQKRAGSKS